MSKNRSCRNAYSFPIPARNGVQQTMPISTTLSHGCTLQHSSRK